MLAGCASPGAPRPPSLQLPQVSRDLTAERSGPQVLLHFSVPSETSEGLPLRSRQIQGRVCRQAGEHGKCQPVQVPQAVHPLRVPLAGHTPESVQWVDTLPPELLQGVPHVIGYRLELLNENGRSAGYSAPVFTVSGAAPKEVEDLQAKGTRNGVLLQWTLVPDGGEVLLQRRQVGGAQPTTAAKPRREKRGSSLPGSARSSTTENGTVWLQAEPGNRSVAQTMDGGVADGDKYSYVAVRREIVQVSGRSLELRSAPSTPVEIAWKDVYPPPAPQGLTAVGFHLPGPTAGGTEGFAVDLVWKPVSDLRVTGYIVQRSNVVPDSTTGATLERLTPEPVTTPAFHDSTARPHTSYRYEVTAVDAKGNVSQAAVAVVNASEE